MIGAFFSELAGQQACHHSPPTAGGTVSLSSASYSAVEGGEVNVTIQLARVSGMDAVTVQLSTSDGTATGESVCSTQYVLVMDCHW